MFKKTIILGVMVCVWAFSFEAQTLGQKKGKKQKGAFAPIKVDPSLPHVLIIGDSISIGYTTPVRKFLKGKANVHRIRENGGPTIRGLSKIDAWLGKRHWDVIHFNWGLHDLKMDKKGNHQVPLKKYEANLRKLVKRMKEQSRVLIWASTTPVPKGKVSPPRKNEDVVAYNTAAKKIMQSNGVLINDLYGFILPKLAELQRPANVHFTPKGSTALGRKVAHAIQDALKKLPKAE